MRKISEILQPGEDFEEFMLDCCMNFSTFFTRVLGFDLNWHHAEVYHLVDRFRKVCVLAPRQTGKTTLIYSFFLWKVLFNNKIDILIVSNSHQQAKDIIEKMQNEMEDNEILSQLIPKNREITWSKNEINTTTKCKIVAKANNPNIRGGTFDFVLCDEAGQYDNKSNFYGVILPTLEARNGKVIVIGTPMSKIDLLSELGDPDSPFVYKCYRIIQDNKPLWDKKYPIEKVEEIKKNYLVGGSVLEFEREWMCNPVGDETSLFPFEMLSKGFDKKSAFISYGIPERRYFLAADFAMSASAKADYSVFIVGEQDINNNLRIARMERSHGESFESQYERFAKLYRNFRVVKSMVDEGSFGKAFFQRFKDEGFVVEPFNFKGERRQDLLTKLRNMFENNKIIIPRNKEDTDTVMQTDVLIQELMDMGISFTEKLKKVKWDTVGRHDDTVMALGMLVMCVEERMGKPSITFV